MNRRVVSFFLYLTLMLAVTGVAQASIVFTLDPTNGSVSGAPGDTVGWGFTVTNDSALEWIVVTGSTLYTNKDYNPGYTGATPWGTYTDLMSNSITYDTPLGPTSSLTLPFAPGANPQTGAGSFAIDIATPYNDQAIGYIVFDYQVFTENPALNYSAPYTFASSPQINVAISTPEPSTYALLCISLGVVGFARKRMVKSEG